MTSPTNVAGAGMGASVAGTILSAFGANQTGKATAAQYQYQAGVAKAKQAIDLQNRDYALATGDVQAENYGLHARNVMGKIRAGQGASGIDVGGASAVAVRQGQQMTTDRDLAQIRNNAARVAYGHEVEAAFDEAQSGAYLSASANVKKATGLNVAASLLSGAGSVSSKWLQGKSVGLWDS